MSSSANCNCTIINSLTLKRLELSLLANSWYGKATIFVLGDIAGIYELLEERCSDITILPLRFQLIILLLNTIELSQLVLDRLLLEEFGLLIGRNLVLRSAAL